MHHRGQDKATGLEGARQRVTHIHGTRGGNTGTKTNLRGHGKQHAVHHEDTAHSTRRQTLGVVDVVRVVVVAVVVFVPVVFAVVVVVLVVLVVVVLVVVVVLLLLFLTMWLLFLP